MHMQLYRVTKSYWNGDDYDLPERTVLATYRNKKKAYTMANGLQQENEMKKQVLKDARHDPYPYSCLQFCVEVIKTDD